MSGYGLFKYRVSFELCNFWGDPNPRVNSKKYFLDAVRFMTDKLGYGPELQLAHWLNDHNEGVPPWAVRYDHPSAPSASEVIYLRGEDEKKVFESLLTFLILKDKKGS